MKRLKIIFIVCLLLSGCAASGQNTSGIIQKEAHEEIVHDAFTIKPSGSQEECIELRPNMVFDYEYEASDSVNFNIHYHAEDDVYYPVDTKGTRSGKGTVEPGSHHFYTPKQEFYCLMWDNISAEPVNVSFRCTLKQGPNGKMHH